MPAATGGRRWLARPPRWRRWRLRCCCEVWQGWQAVGAVQVGQGWRWCVVIGCGAGGADPSRCRWWPVRSAAAAGCWRGHRGNGGTTPSACRSADPAGRAGGRRVKARQKKKARAAARGALLLWPSVCTGGAICCAGCVPVHIVGGGVCSPFRCRAAGAGTDPGATVPAAPDPAARPALAVLHPVRFCPAAGGVRFSTLPGSALGVGLELSEL